MGMVVEGCSFLWTCGSSLVLLVQIAKLECATGIMPSTTRRGRRGEGRRKGQSGGKEDMRKEEEGKRTRIQTDRC